jgi:hypothetical protein
LNHDTYIYIAYITGRLISGKKIATLYDYSQTGYVHLSKLADNSFFKDFDEKHRDYIPGYATGCRYQYSLDSGQTVELSINGSSFIGHIRGTSSYFLGNIKGDSIYIFDHEKSEHFNYKISAHVVEHEGESIVCHNCCFLK